MISIIYRHIKYSEAFMSIQNTMYCIFHILITTVKWQCIQFNLAAISNLWRFDLFVQLAIIIKYSDECIDWIIK